MIKDDDDNTACNLIIDANATASGGDNDLIHISGDDAGYYDLELTAAQTNYIGRVLLSINYVTDHCPVFHEFVILPAQVYDSLVLGTDLLDANASQLGGTSQTGRDVGASVLLSSGSGAGRWAGAGETPAGSAQGNSGLWSCQSLPEPARPGKGPARQPAGRPSAAKPRAASRA